MLAAPYNMKGNHISKSCQKYAIARKNATAAQKACNCGIFSADSDRSDRDITQKAQCEVARFSRAIGIFCNAGRNAAAHRQQAEALPQAGKKPAQTREWRSRADRPDAWGGDGSICDLTVSHHRLGDATAAGLPEAGVHVSDAACSKSLRACVVCLCAGT